MYYSTEDIKRIEDFQKYARFICDHFDIEVQLDSTKAETNGKVICLPNIIGMSEEEVDMMYTILLHEAGHIKFSLFTEDAFLKLKTEFHAHLANSIEDARIENLLMKEFGGAKEMFEKLYCQYAVNRKLMKKVFNIQGKRVDLFHCLGLYIHAYLLDCKTAPFSRIASHVNYKKIKGFVVKHNIHNLLNQSPLKNWDDVIALTNIIYDLFIKEFADKSKKCDFAADLALKKAVQDKLEAIRKEVEKKQQELAKTQEKIKEKNQERNAWDEAHTEELEQHEDQMRSFGEQINDIRNEINQRNQREKAQRLVDKQQQNVNSLQNKLDKVQQEIAELNDKMQKGLNANNRPFTEKQKENNQKSLTSKESNEKSLEQKMRDAYKSLDEAQKELLKQPSQSEQFKDISNEELSEQLKPLQEKFSQVQQEYNQLTADRNAIDKQIDELQSQINNAFSEMQSKVLAQMYELDKKGLTQDFPVEVLPEFQETPGWEEADQAQRDFDKKASEQRKEIVRNGGRMAGLIGTNLRDLSVYIDKKLEKVKEINLLDIFEKKANISRLPQMNEGQNGMMTNTMIDKSVLSNWGSIEKHTVLTTQFDTIKNENDNKLYKEVNQLATENAAFIKDLKRTFMNRFKFTKKDYYRGGKEEGQLDARNLWKLPTRQGDDYFEINNPKFINKMAASILIDISGSQDKEETDYGKKLKVLALTLSESLKTVHVNHEILGFHAPVCDEMRTAGASYNYNRRSNKLETIVYKNFMQKDNFGIGNIEIQSSDNSDGESVRIALQRLKRERAKSKVLFIITDGKPFLSDGEVEILDADLKSALREAVNQKVQVFALGFAPNGKDFYGERFCHIQNFNDVVKFVDKMTVI